MSLLMKALEKAAKDREGGENTAAAKDGIALEPMPARAAPAPREPAPAAAPPARSSGTADARQPAEAAAVIHAARRGGGGVTAVVRERPLFVFGLVAGIAAAGYGGYVYLQLTNPGLFVKQAPRPPQATQVAPPPVPAQPAAATNTTPPPSLASLAPLEAEAPPAAAPAAAPAAKPAAGTAPATPPAIPVPSIGAAIATAAAVATQTAAAVAQERRGAAAPAAPTPPAAAAALPLPVIPLPQAPAADMPRDTIKVTAGSTTPVVNPLLTEGYAALNSGNLDAAQRLYNQMLRSDPGSIDALLGLAAIATQQGNTDEATRRYLKVLEVEPRNALAQAGLIGMLGRADPQSSETRVKQLIAREPAAAYLHFALGITYVDQKRWPDAQQSFFQAHQLQPDNPDYAYNLAVALEHIGQPKAALDFYRRAVQSATGRARVNFSTVAAEARIGKLEKVVK